MGKCIYSWVELNQNDPPDDNSESKEHIVPWAIGGSDGLTTQDASKKWNNDFGSSIDKPFADALPIAIARHQLKITGHSGKIPPIVWELRSSETGNIGKVVIDVEGSVSVTFDPVVVTEDRPTHQNRLVAGSTDKVKRIFDGMLESAKRKGWTICNPRGDVLDSWDSALQSAEVEVSKNFNGQIVAIDWAAWNRGMFKMALGLCHLVLGPDWTFSNDSDRFRAILVNDRKDWPSLKGINSPQMPDVERFLGKSTTVVERRQHALLVLPGRTPVAVISLFGGTVPEFAISTGDVLGRYGLIENMPAHQIVGFRVDPVTRETTELHVADLGRFAGVM